MDSIAERPSFDDTYLCVAFVLAQRSFDPNTKCGCVLVSKSNRPLSMGYNGPIKGSIDENIPLTRPEKYCHFIHAEENALLAYCGADQDIQGATAYVTGRPCHRCLRMLLQKGITRIVYGVNAAKVLDIPDMEAQHIMLDGRDVEIIELPHNDSIKAVLRQTEGYMDCKELENKGGEANG